MIYAKIVTKLGDLAVRTYIKILHHEGELERPLRGYDIGADVTGEAEEEG